MLSAWAADSAAIISISRVSGRPAESMRTARREMVGNASLKSWRRLPCKSVGWKSSPVMLPPGRAMLATSPLRTGSSMVAMSSQCFLGYSYGEFRIGWSKNASAIEHPLRRRVADKRHDNFHRGAAADGCGDFLHNSRALLMLDSEAIELVVPHLHIRLCPAYEAA